MAYEMRVKGRPDPIVIDHGADVLIAKHEQYLQTKVDEAVVINGWHGRLSLINDFMATRGSSAEKPSSSDEVHRLYLEDLKAIRAWPIDKRASQIGFFRLVYWAFTGKNSEEVQVNGRPIEDLAKEIQKQYFTARPLRTICDPAAFKSIIKKTTANGHALRVIERTVLQDQFAENNLK